MLEDVGVLSIDLGAIQDNWRMARSQLVPTTVCAAVLKADAYGIGVGAVAPALYDAGCRVFYLATLEEALEVRLLLPNEATIYVFGLVCSDKESDFVVNQLIPVLSSYDAVLRWVNFCKKEGQAFPCAIKIDTGMTRAGISSREVGALIELLSAETLLQPNLLISHLACADDVLSLQNNLQLEEFSAAAKEIKLSRPQIKCSLANSSGVFLGREFHFDMVRVGASLYGINPQISRPNPLTPVVHLKLPVLQTRVVDRDSLIGYGGSRKAVAGTRLALVAGGYADGLHRSLGFCPEGRALGVKVEVMGRVSMDSCVYDISAVSGEIESIEVINRELTLDYLIAKTKSLGYEVLTSLGRRFIRHYY